MEQKYVWSAKIYLNGALNGRKTESFCVHVSLKTKSPHSPGTSTRIVRALVQVALEVRFTVTVTS